MSGPNVGYATLTIVPSTKGIKSALQGQTGPPLRSAGASGGVAMGEGMVGSLKGLLGPAMAALGTLAIGSFVKSSISAAADLEQSVGAIDSVFKQSAGQMHEWADTAATTVGLTKNEYNELGTLIGSQLKNAGTSMKELGPKTNELIGLGADLSSMFGGSTREAVEALSSALKGERDPIERYGVSLKQATIDAKAAELGFEKVDGALSSEANAAATLALIMDQTADAHGNFARETDTLANRQQVLSAMWEDGKAKLGTLFLPAVTGAATALLSVLGPAIDGAIGFAERFSGAWSAAAELLRTGDFSSSIREALGVEEDSPLVAMLLGIRDTAKEIGTTVAPLLTPLMDALGRLGGSALELFSAFSPMSLIFQALAPVLPQLAALLTEVATVLADHLGAAFANARPMIEGLVTVVGKLFEALMPVVSEILSAAGPALAALSSAFLTVQAAVLPLVSAILEALIPALQPIIEQLGPLVAAVFDAITAAIGPVVDILVAILVPAIEALLPVVQAVFSTISGVISGVMQFVSGIINAVLAVIQGDWSGAWEALKSAGEGIWNAISSLVSGLFETIKGLISGALSWIGNLWTSAWSNISSFLRGVMTNIALAVARKITEVVNFFRDLPGKILGFLSGLGNSLWQAGVDMIQGLINGINSMLGSIGEAILNLIPEGIRGPFEKALGIHSPSRVFRGYGVNIGEGLALGIGDMTGEVQDAANNLAPSFDPVVVPDIEAGGLQGSISSLVAGYTASPLVGELAITTPNVEDGLDSALYHLRRLKTGGRYAR